MSQRLENPDSGDDTFMEKRPKLDLEESVELNDGRGLLTAESEKELTTAKTDSISDNEIATQKIETTSSSDVCGEFQDEDSFDARLVEIAREYDEEGDVKKAESSGASNVDVPGTSSQDEFKQDMNLEKPEPKQNDEKKGLEELEVISDDDLDKKVVGELEEISDDDFDLLVASQQLR